jgi:hypothetical protein
MTWRSTICLLSLMVAVGCARHAKPPKAAAAKTPERQCYAARDPRTFAQPVRPHDWLTLLVRLELGRGGVFATQDCLGRRIRVEPAPIAEESVVERDMGDSLHAVWIITHRYDGGDGYGVLALVRRDKSGLATLALGALRMRTERVKLDHWRIQNQSLLVASGETCAAADQARPTGRVGSSPSCQRTVRIASQRGTRLIEAPLLDAAGKCLQPPGFELARQHERGLPSGLRRRFELTANVTHDARHVVIEERLLVRDVDPSAPLLPPREVQHVETSRLIQPLPDGRLVTRQASLWSRAVEGHGDHDGQVSPSTQRTSAHKATR